MSCIDGMHDDVIASAKCPRRWEGIANRPCFGAAGESNVVKFSGKLAMKAPAGHPFEREWQPRLRLDLAAANADKRHQRERQQPKLQYLSPTQ